MISVSYWGSIPHTNDDCDCTWDFETVDEAIKFFYRDPAKGWNPKYIELSGEGYKQTRRNPNYVPDDDYEHIQRKEWEGLQRMMGNY